ncbi:MAG TPA: hypothetical protein VF060_32360 [Trebonia sp.]
MSSAILYVAIVAIWACVLIPRWLHRGTATTVTEASDVSSEGIDPTSQDSPSPDAEAEETGEPTVRQGSERAFGDPSERELHESPSRGPLPRGPLSREESRRRMLAARRRLLLMLLALEAAGITLTVLHLAALWVLIPPTIMLLGYLLLLREAAHGDAERARREAEAEEARSRSRARAEARAQARDRRTAPPPAAPVPAAPEPAPEDYSDLGDGRDYAPGLAGKYTTSDSGVIDLSEYKRAVGD